VQAAAMQPVRTIYIANEKIQSIVPAAGLVPYPIYFPDTSYCILFPATSI